jgi:hydrogenase assembly chaperone HypC/HupF
MCLGQICQVRSLPAEGLAAVDHEGLELTVSLMALREPVGRGDWVVVHSGFVLERLGRDEALEALALRAGTDPDHASPGPTHHAEAAT